MGVISVQPLAVGGVIVTVWIAGAKLDIYSAVDPATVEAVLLVVKLC